MRFFSVVVVLLLCASCAGQHQGVISAASQSASAASEPVASGVSPPVETETLILGYGRSFLTASEQDVYDALNDLAESFDVKSAISVPAEITNDRLTVIIQYLLDDNPQHYWAVPRWGIGENREVSLEVIPHLTIEQAVSRNQEIEFAAELLLKDLSADPFEAATQLHDRLAAHTVYDTRADPDDAGNLYAALIDCMTICDGYAKSYQYLAKRSGMECVYIRGTEPRGRAHAWNAVRIDGIWLYVDVTWDDKANLRHDYLCITGEEIGREHDADVGQYPRLPDSEQEPNDFYSHNGYIVTSAQDRDITEALAQAFARRIEDQKTFGQSYLQIKVQGDAAFFSSVQSRYFADVFAVLRRSNEILAERSSSVRVVTGGSVECNYNEIMRTLSLTAMVIEE